MLSPVSILLQAPPPTPVSSANVGGGVSVYMCMEKWDYLKLITVHWQGPAVKTFDE